MKPSSKSSKKSPSCFQSKLTGFILKVGVEPDWSQRSMNLPNMLLRTASQMDEKSNTGNKINKMQNYALSFFTCV